MNLKEVSELRRRFRMDRNAISRIYGCFVNSSREIVSYIDESMGILPQDEAEKYLNLLKKALSGKSLLQQIQVLLCFVLRENPHGFIDV